MPAASSSFRALCLLLLPQLTWAQATNTTALPTDPSVNLTGDGWSVGGVDSAGAVPCGNWTQNIGDSAIFHFNGTSFYLFGHTANNPQSVWATLDGINLVSAHDLRKTFCDDILFTASNLTNGDHTLNVTFVGPRQNNFLVVQSLLVTQPEPSQPQPQESPQPQQLLHPRESPQSQGKEKSLVGPILGSIVGGISFLVLILSWLNAHHMAYIFNSLVFFLTGWYFYKSRRLLFIADNHLPSTEITLFLTKGPTIYDSVDQDSDLLVVWQVIIIGGQRRSFSVDCPCQLGTTTLGFGTIDDTDGVVRSVDYHVAPAYLDSDNTWGPPEGNHNANDSHLIVGNRDMPTNIALGTLDKENDAETLRPFCVIKSSAIPMGAIYQAETDLYLHAFRTHGYYAGAYGQTLVKKFEQDRLTKPSGIRVMDLKPYTDWFVQMDSDGRLKLNIRGNRHVDRPV